MKMNARYMNACQMRKWMHMTMFKTIQPLHFITLPFEHFCNWEVRYSDSYYIKFKREVNPTPEFLSPVHLMRIFDMRIFIRDENWKQLLKFKSTRYFTINIQRAFRPWKFYQNLVSLTFLSEHFFYLLKIFRMFS